QREAISFCLGFQAIAPRRSLRALASTCAALAWVRDEKQTCTRKSTASLCAGRERLGQSLLFELLAKRRNENIAAAGVFRVADTCDDNNRQNQDGQDSPQQGGRSGWGLQAWRKTQLSKASMKF